MVFKLNFCFSLQSHSNEPILKVKTRVAELLKQPLDSLSFSFGTDELPKSKDRSLLSSLGEQENLTLVVKVSQAITTSSSTALALFQDDFEDAGASARSTPTPAVPTPACRSRDEEEAQKSLPGVMMASGERTFKMLYSLASLNDPKVIAVVRRLLHLIPTDATVLDALDSSVSQGATAKSTSSSADPTSPKLSPRRKKAGAGMADVPQVGCKQGQSEEDAEIDGRRITVNLGDLFNANAEGMSPFRVLYNLEVLSSRLMPTDTDGMLSSVSSVQAFSTKFLHCGGLAIVLGVMDRDSMPADVDYDVRQSSYLLALQLAYHLLCGQDLVLPESLGRKSSRIAAAAAASATATSSPSPFSASATNSPVIKPTPPKRTALDASSASSSSCPPSSIKSPVVASATKIVQTMKERDFASAVSCLVRVTWAAAVGNLQLAATIFSSPSSQSQPAAAAGTSPGRPKKVADRPRFFFGSRRSRDSSTGSSGSEGSSSVDGQSQQSGTSSQSWTVSPGDSQIAGEAFELLVACLEMRTNHLATFFDLPSLSDFVVDTVLNSPSEQVRAKARDQLIKLSRVRCTARALNLDLDAPQPETLSPKYVLTRLLLKTPVPLWAPTCTARGISHSLLSQCSEYFDLRCTLLRELTARDQALLEKNAQSMVDDELNFLQNFTLCNRYRDCCLLSGHLRLLEALLTCEGVEKKQVGSKVIPEILSSFLFPAAKLMREGELDRSDGAINFELFQDLNPKCDTPNSRVAAYNVLVELSRDCAANLSVVSKELIAMHHSFSEHLVRDFEYSPAVDRRAESGFVGLKNAGATCYMNSVLQQLFCTPGVAGQVFI